MLRIMKQSVVVALGLTMLSVANAESGQQDPVSGNQTKVDGDIVTRHCDNKYPGDDQQSQLSISLKDKSGNERKTVYLRLWKDMKGEDSVLDKMVLFTMFPPDAKGAAFMRWAYDAKAEKNAEQWIYLPVLRKIRRVSVRDLGDSFLGSDLTYGDISYRAHDADEHKLLRIDQDKAGNKYFLVASTPKESDPQYSKRLSWYRQGATWDECVKVRVDYFDTKGAFLKRQLLTWQQVGPAWVWDQVKVQNAQTFHESFFEVRKVKINEGVDDDWFSERRLKIGLK